MKKKLTLFLLGSILGLLIYYGHNTISKHQLKEQLVELIKYLPNCTFYDLNEHIVSIKNLSKQNLVLVYFHPECEHCQYEVEELYKHQHKFLNTQILMISPAPLQHLKKFNHKYDLDSSDNISVLWDKEFKFDTYFGASIFPTVIIYQDTKFVKTYKGEVKIEAIIKHLN